MRVEPKKTAWQWVLGKAIFLIALVAWLYWPAIHGSWLWDDTLDITDNPVIKSPSGLWSIWFQPGTLVDYYPLKASVQWFQWRLWGLDTLGYHLTNIALHTLNALLLWRLFGKLRLPWAYFGALLFAVHPANVESVAWIAELKNTLSFGPFILAMLAWIDFEDHGRASSYALAFVLFLVAMLSKTSMVMFPCVLLLYAWHQRQKISFIDICLSAPFFAVSLTLGLMTALCSTWAMTYYHQSSFPFQVGGILQRFALAGGSAGAYISHFLWPVGLLPIYPRWSLNPLPLYFFIPYVALGVVVWICLRNLDTWGRHMLLGIGFFALMILPVLGFKSISFMYYTWVMDHFLYIPMIGLIGLVLFAAQALRTRYGLFYAWPCIGAVVLCSLAMVGRSHAAHFTNRNALWTYTIQGNPTAFAAYSVLAKELVEKGQFSEALREYNVVLHFQPHFLDALISRGRVRQVLGDNSGAIEDLNRAEEEFHPAAPTLYLHRGLAEAIEQIEPRGVRDLRTYIEFDPQSVTTDYAHLWIWEAQTKAGFPEEADAELAGARDHLFKPAKDGWTASIAAFLLGELSREQLFDLSHEGSPASLPGKECEFYYYAGEKRLIAGNRYAACTDFRAAIATKKVLFFEYQLAQQELKRLPKE